MRKAGLENAALRAGVAIVLLTMGGCSSVPDSINPAEWYRSASSWISPGEAAKGDTAEGNGADGRAPDTVAPAAQQAESESTFPSLASVPQRPAGTIDPAARGSLVETMRRESEEGHREAQALGTRTDRLVDSRELPPQAPAAGGEIPPLPPSGAAAADSSGIAHTDSAATTAAFTPGQRLAPRPPVMPPQPVSVGLSG